MLSIKWRNILRVARQPARYTSSAATENVIKLENLSPTRSLIRVRGDQIQPFLQGLITNDISHVAKSGQNDSIFTMFLNKAGRILYDAIVYRTPEDNTFFIECDKRVDGDLRKHMLVFRIRKKIDIDIVNDEYRLWAAFPVDTTKQQDQKYQQIPAKCGVISCYPDPRLKLLGTRIIAPTGNGAVDIEQVVQDVREDCDSGYNYVRHRYALGIGEGIYELPPEKSFPFEANCDYLNGISFHKGCYLGQEFTARTYHTGVIRKRLMPIELDKPVSKSQRHVDLLEAQITSEKGDALGKLRGVEGDAALGLLRIDQALKAKSLHFADLKGLAKKPSWWSTEVPKQTKL